VSVDGETQFEMMGCVWGDTGRSIKSALSTAAS
jgi:hypothetical protein